MCFSLRAPIRRALAVLALLGGIALAPHAATAHAILMSSTPHTGATVPAGPLDITLRFNSRIDAERSKLEIAPKATGGAAQATIAWQRITLVPGSGPEILTAHTTLPAAASPVPFVLRWQVLAVDGHITRGIIPLTVGATSAPAPAPAAMPALSPSPAPAPSPGASPAPGTQP